MPAELQSGSVHRWVTDDTICDECGSSDVEVQEFDYGRCSQTDYHDAGEVLVCLDCGHREIL